MFAGAGTNPGEKTLEDKFFEKEVCSITHASPDSSDLTIYLVDIV